MLDVIDAIKHRASVRAFLPTPVARTTLHAILDAARWAPSGVNTQPWQVAVVGGECKQRISAALIQQHRAAVAANPDYQYYPTDWFEPYKSRRFACGMALYGALDIARDDRARRQQVWEMNYAFFGAPVALFFLVDARLALGSWLDNGMFLQNVMLAARGYGLETCPQAALAEYPDTVRQLLSLTPEHRVICGMALGYADHTQAINQYRTERMPVDAFTEWHDID